MEACGAETCFNNELAEVGGFWKVTERGVLVRKSWIDGEDMETFPEDPYEMVRNPQISRLAKSRYI